MNKQKTKVKTNKKQRTKQQNKKGMEINWNDLEKKYTEFQVKVWKELVKIPRGETRSYKQIAIAIGNPKAYRAVANACNANPLAPHIPCHRVVGTNNLGGYRWGIEKKKELLNSEKRI